MIHPHDRFGKAISDRYCTREMERALNDYRYACDAASVAVRNQLKSLADTLQVLCCAVLCCAVLCCAVLCCAVLCCAACQAEINSSLELLVSILSVRDTSPGALPGPICILINILFGMHPLSCLACVVQKSLLQIVAASSFAIVAAALECHVNEASRRGWALPTQLHKGTIACLPVCPPLPACVPSCLSVCLSL